MSKKSRPDTTNRHSEILAQAEVQSKLPKIVNFEDLAVCGEEIWIENNGDLYRLRRTKQGKLILTK